MIIISDYSIDVNVNEGAGTAGSSLGTGSGAAAVAGGIGIAGGIGMLASAMVNSSASLKSLLDLFSSTVGMILRPIGDLLATFLRPLAMMLIPVAIGFNDLLYSKGWFDRISLFLQGTMEILIGMYKLQESASKLLVGTLGILFGKLLRSVGWMILGFNTLANLFGGDNPFLSAAGSMLNAGSTVGVWGAEQVAGSTVAFTEGLEYITSGMTRAGVAIMDWGPGAAERIKTLAQMNTGEVVSMVNTIATAGGSLTSALNEKAQQLRDVQIPKVAGSSKAQENEYRPEVKKYKPQKEIIDGKIFGESEEDKKSYFGADSDKVDKSYFGAGT